MATSRIADSLLRATERHRLVFWYDAAHEWTADFDAFNAPGVEKLKVEGTEFGTKVRITRLSSPDQRFLVYLPSARPPKDSENWLLDLLLQGHEFKADRASLALQEAGLAYEFKELAEQHIRFFSEARRTHALRDALSPNDQASDVRLKMMEILAGTTGGIDALLLRFLRSKPTPIETDPVRETFGPANLVDPFWTQVARLYGYTAVQPSLIDFARFLFSAANPLDGKVPLRPDAKVLLQRWKDSREHAESFATWSREMERRLHIAEALEAHGDQVVLGDCDTFEIFDKFIIRHLCTAFEIGSSSADLRTVLLQRKNLFWRDTHAHGYDAIEHAIELRELLAGVDLSIGSIDEGWKRYLASWWRIDRAYRCCVWHLRGYNQTKVMQRVSTWVEKNYVTNFLLPLADRWGDQVLRLDTWRCNTLWAQRQFFSVYVQPFLDRGQKVFVVISDALRYEAAADFAAQLNTENRWSAEVDAVLGSLPSYTQLGMAALLPGQQPLSVEPSNGVACIGDRSTAGTENRRGILRDVCGGRATALMSEDFCRMNSKAEGRDLMRDHDVIYVFHNKIDKIGDSLATEAATFDAVRDTFDDLLEILKKIANINGSNMLLTADHGFLFQQDDINEHDLKPLPALPEGVDWSYQNRRFALSPAAPVGPDIKTFSARQLGLDGDWTATFPLSLGRFPIKGAGKRFVHGGFSLQEVVVPVVRVRKARSDDTETVDVEIMRAPLRITTGQISLSVFQNTAVGGKTLGRTLRIGVFFGDTQLSDTKTVTFDFADAEPRSREKTFILTLSALADQYNNRDVEIRLDEETVAGSGNYATYQRQNVRLHKPFARDFDE